ncbi:MAG: hypothetical protein IKG58_02020 [Bacilli bacterium]|nr:hypothetical protein [Bacilli bacterium]
MNNGQNTVNQVPNPTVQSTVKPTVQAQPATTPQPSRVAQPVQQVSKQPAQPQKKVKKKKSHKGFIIFLLLLIIGGMGYYIYTDYQKDLRNKCSPLVTGKDNKNTLELDSTIVQDLYQKVQTNINEDIASTDLDDNMKLYLAYRQIPRKEIYESNCNLFDNSSMQSIKCNKSSTFVPLAFKEESLQREVKKLFGEETNIENNNIQLSNSCLGGFQYIKDRGEYVSGDCNGSVSTIYKADKELIEAYAYNDTIVLKEKVRYYGSEEVDISRLKNGVYVYTFKLDNNYNYAYISKEFEEKK